MRLKNNFFVFPCGLRISVWKILLKLNMTNNNYHLSRKLLIKFLGDPDYISNMNALLSQVNTSVSADDIRIPDPPNNTTEGDFTSLPEFVFPFLSNDKNSSWWKNALKNYSPYCWDFVSTCTINGKEGPKKGLLLIEAKAKKGELITAARDRKPVLKLEENYSIAGSDLRKVSPEAKLNSVICRQMSNHIYRAWFLARSGIPVVLLYLGFHFEKGIRVFNTAEAWRKYFLRAARKIGVNNLLNKEIYCGDSTFKMICASLGSDEKAPPVNPHFKDEKIIKKIQKKNLEEKKLQKKRFQKKFIDKQILKSKKLKAQKIIAEKYSVGSNVFKDKRLIQEESWKENLEVIHGIKNINVTKENYIHQKTQKLLRTKSERAAIIKKLSSKKTITNKRYSKKSFDPKRVLEIFNENLLSLQSGNKLSRSLT